METFAELGVVGLGVLVAARWSSSPERSVHGGRGTPQRRSAAFVAWSAAAAVDWHWEMVGVTITALLAGSIGLVTAERGAPRPASRWSCSAGVDRGLRPPQPLRGLEPRRQPGAVRGPRGAHAQGLGGSSRRRRRARALLFWSAEPELVLGDAAAGLGNRQGALREYRDAVATDPRNWVAWLRVAQVARGAERVAAYRRVRQLNPREEGLPGA